MPNCLSGLAEPVVGFGAEQDEVNRERENREAHMERNEGPANIEMMPNLVHDIFLVPEAWIATDHPRKRAFTG
jgi:hypothetical protein